MKQKGGIISIFLNILPIVIALLLVLGVFGIVELMHTANVISLLLIVNILILSVYCFFYGKRKNAIFTFLALIVLNAIGLIVRFLISRVYMPGHFLQWLLPLVVFILNLIILAFSIKNINVINTRTSYVIGIASLIISIIITLFSKVLIAIILGRDYLPISPILQVLAIMFPFFIIAVIMTNKMIEINKKLPYVTITISSILTLIGGLISVRLLSVIGIFLILSLVYIINAIILFFYFRKIK